MLKIKLNNHKKFIIFSYATTGINIINGFVLFPLIIKYMGLAALGVFGLFYSMKSIVDIGISWFSGSITKNLIQEKDKKNILITVSFLINIFYGVIGAIVFFLYGFFFKNDYIYSSLFFALYLLLNFSFVPIYEVMISELQQYKVAFFRFLQQSFFLVFAISSFFIFDNVKLYMVFVALFFSALIVFSVTISYYFKFFHESFEYKGITRKLLKKLLLQDGSKFFLNGMSTILLLQVDVLLLDFFYGSETVGVYLILWKIPNTLIMLGWRLSDPYKAIVADKIIKMDIRDVRKDFLSLEKKIFGASLIAAIGYLLLGKYVLEFWVGVEKVPVIAYMYVVSAVVIVFSIMQRLYLSVNYYTKGLNTTTLLQFIKILFKVVFIIVLFDKFRELSTVVGVLVAYLFTFLVYRWNSLRVFEKY